MPLDNPIVHAVAPVDDGGPETSDDAETSDETGPKPETSDDAETIEDDRFERMGHWWVPMENGLPLPNARVAGISKTYTQWYKSNCHPCSVSG